MRFLPFNRASEIRRGDPHLFDWLHREYAPRVQNYLRLMTGNATEAEDLTQETFLAAFQCRETYRGNAQPLAWLLGIARRRWRDCNRARRLEQVALSEDLLYETDVASQVIRANHLECSLAQLEPLAREAVVLVLGHGLTYVEAAEILEQPVGTVKWKVHCATRQLRQTLMEDERL